MGRRGPALAAAALAVLLAAPAASLAHDDPFAGPLRSPEAQPRDMIATIFGSAASTPVAGYDGPSTPTAYADCGPGARPETGLQGQIPLADQKSGRSRLGYRCNLRLIGSNDIKLRGANFQLAWYRDCAYVSLIGVRRWAAPLGESEANRPLDGLAILDASDPTRPRFVDMLRSPVQSEGMHEGVEVNERRGMLVVQQGGNFARYIEIYDVSQDCTKPVLKSRYDAGVPVFHGMKISDDGNTVYASDQTPASASGQILHVLDVSDMEHPRVLVKWDPSQELRPDRYGAHDLELNHDGTRAYLGATPPQVVAGVFVAGPPSAPPGPSVAVLDTSDIQERKAERDVRVVSTLGLPNFGHTVQRARIAGKPYLFVSGEAPFGGALNCPWAWGHIVDISNERAPRAVADIKLDVNQQSNCALTGFDDAVYSIHYAGVDDERDTKRAFFTYYSGGLRVFDVRDPENPKEIGYYHPAGTAKTALPPALPTTPDDTRPEVDMATSVIRYRPETGHIWMVSVAGGFQILKLTGSVADTKGSVRLLPARLRDVLRMRTVKARVRCSLACKTKLELRVAGRRAGTRTVSLARSARRTVRLRLDRRALRDLRRNPGAPLRLTARVSDPDTGDALQTLRARPRALR
jgi:hypothetical protein